MSTPSAATSSRPWPSRGLRWPSAGPSPPCWRVDDRLSSRREPLGLGRKARRRAAGHDYGSSATMPNATALPTERRRAHPAAPTAAGSARRGRLDQADPGALLLRRLALPRRPAGRGPAARRRRGGRRAGRRPGRRACRSPPGERAPPAPATPSGPGLIIDTSRHLNAIVAIDPEARTAVVEPGVVQSSLQAAAAPYGLRFGPDPSTHNRCTIGGMIGNNACGPRALGYGKTADNVVALDVVTGSGERLRLDGTDRPGPLRQPDRAAAAWSAATSGTIRTEFGRFGRQVSGYSLEHLLPENRFDVARFLAGTEGTLAVILGATVRLVADAPYKIMIALGYPSDGRRRATRRRSIVGTPPTAGEGLDRRIVDVVRRTRGDAAVPPLPRGDGWMFVELVGDDPAELAGPGRRAAGRRRRRWTASWSTIRPRRWRCGRSARTAPGWPGSAWPSRPTRAGRTPRCRRSSSAPICATSTRCSTEHGLDGLPYGHFGDGCVHIRIDFPLTSEGGGGGLPLLRRAGGRAGGRLRRLDVGRARRRPGPLGAAAGDVLRRRRSACSARSRRSSTRTTCSTPACWSTRDRSTPTPRRWPWSAGSTTSPRRCTTARGVGKCLANTTAGLGVMCPSYQATRDEKDSTRGRARVLQEMINGDAGPAGLEVAGGARGARSLPVLQGLCPGLPDRDRHGGVQGAGAGPHLSRPAAAAQPLRAGLAAALGPADHPLRGLAALVNFTTAYPGSAPARPLERRGRPAPVAAAVRRAGPPGAGWR